MLTIAMIVGALIILVSAGSAAATPTAFSPSLSTGDATSISTTGATLQGSVASATQYRFDYGTTTAYGSTTPWTSVSAGSSPVAATAALTSLAPSTTYHFRVEATGAGASQGADQSFTTAAPPAQTDLAQGRPAVASSTESSSYPASNAFDGDPSTRWSSQYSDPQWIYVDLGTTYNVNEVKLNWETAYASAYQIQVSNDAQNWTTIYSTTTGTGGVNDLTGLTGAGRYVRMYGTARGTQWGYSLWAMSVYGSPSSVKTNLALGRPAVTSSTESSSYPASNAFDGDLTTRWSSQWSDPQWIYVDLGSAYDINEVQLNWETAYAKAYQIQVSNDAQNWTTIYSTTTGTGGVNDLTGLTGSGRFVRMYGTARGTQWGYSLYEMSVYGKLSANQPPPPSNPPPPSQPTPQTSWTSPSSLPLSDSAAAALVTHQPETRPNNAGPNSYVPSAAEVQAFQSATNPSGQTPAQYNPLDAYVDGRDGLSNPSTDDLIQWTAHKWGIPEDWIRAEMVSESRWNQSGVGDSTGVSSSCYSQFPSFSQLGNNTVYESLGIAQVRWSPNECGGSGTGSEPLRWKSTAFNLDYYAAQVRYYYDGYCNWCGSGYSAGQQWNSIGAWFNPVPWGTSNAYIQSVQNNLANRTWAQPGF